MRCLFMSMRKIVASISDPLRFLVPYALNGKRILQETCNQGSCGSRGKTVNELLTSNWFTDPMFLWEREIPTINDVVPDLSIGDPQVKKAQALQTKNHRNSLADRMSKFLSWSRAPRAIARLLRRATKMKSHSLSTVIERESAELFSIQMVSSRWKDDSDTCHSMTLSSIQLSFPKSTM